MKCSFQAWYGSKITKQLQKGNDANDLIPIDLWLLHLKPLSVQWNVKVHAAIKTDPKLVFKGFE